MERKFEIVGPYTKSAVALAMRRQRKAGKPVPTIPPPPQVRKPAVLVVKETRPPASTKSKISNVCRTLGITPRTIRLYEEKGLIACGRDGKNSRVLDDAARIRLEKVIELKQIGLSLAEIDLYLQAPEKWTARLRGRLQRQIEALDQQKAVVSAFMSQLSD